MELYIKLKIRPFIGQLTLKDSNLSMNLTNIFSLKLIANLKIFLVSKLGSICQVYKSLVHLFKETLRRNLVFDFLSFF
jgi:hypothetical protein